MAQIQGLTSCYSRIGSLLFAVLIMKVNSQNLRHASTLPYNIEVCPGKELILICTVTGPRLAWSSNEYIGSNRELIEFGLFDNTGEEEYHRNVIAKLLSTSRSASKPMIVSQLKLYNILASHPCGTVLCHDVSAGTSESITVSVIADPGTPPQQLLLSQTGCTLKLSWKNLTEVDHYSVIIQSGHTTIKINETSNVTRYSPLSASILEIRVSAVNQCGREGPPQTLKWSTDRNQCCMVNMEPKPCDHKKKGIQYGVNTSKKSVMSMRLYSVYYRARNLMIIMAIILSCIALIGLTCKYRRGSRSNPSGIDWSKKTTSHHFY